jgi:signal transduction histidine kinase
MKSAISVAVLIGFIVVSVPAFGKASHGTMDEAKDLALRAAAYVREVGEEAAFKAFNAGGEWVDRDLYVVVNNESGISPVNAKVPEMVGRNMYDLKDSNGKYFVRDILKVKTEGWVEYKWLDPLTKRLSTKHSYVVRVGSNLIFVGAYD